MCVLQPWLRGTCPQTPPDQCDDSTSEWFRTVFTSRLRRLTNDVRVSAFLEASTNLLWMHFRFTILQDTVPLLCWSVFPTPLNSVFFCSPRWGLGIGLRFIYLKGLSSRGTSLILKSFHKSREKYSIWEKSYKPSVVPDGCGARNKCLPECHLPN